MTKKNIQNSALQPNIPVPTYTSDIADDEIDLRELFGVIWAYKWLTVALCTLAIIGSIFYALTAQEWWVAKGKIVAPETTDNKTFYSQTQRVVTSFNSVGVKIPNGIANAFTAGALFNRFIYEFKSPINKRAFLQQNKTFIEFLDGKSISDDSVDHELTEWAKGIEVLTPKVKESEEVEIGVTLSFRAATQDSSAELLDDYILYISNEVKKHQFEEVSLFFDSSKEMLELRLTLKEERTKKSLQHMLQKAELSYQITNKADLNTYQTFLQQKTEFFDISMGAIALKEKVNVLKSITDLSILDASISTDKMAIRILNELDFNQNLEFTSIRYFENIQRPLNRSQPKRALIVILSTLLAGMLSIFIAFIHYFMIKKDDE